MVILAILTGVIAVLVWKRHTSWFELVILCGWGLLAASTPLGQVPAAWLASLAGTVQGWF